MFLQIQPEESLTSYVRRSLFLNQRRVGMEAFGQLANRPKFRNAEVKTIASAIGWSGCYGFNRLIHNHTLKAVDFIFKCKQEFSYSQKQYIRNDMGFCGWNSSFCPDCVREDLVRLGYSYWRRLKSPFVTVCHKHNTVLMSSCPFCGKVFSRTKHTLDVMWQGCGGSYLDEAISVPNHDPLAFRYAVMVSDILSYPYHLSYEGATKVLRDKAASLIKNLSGRSPGEIKSLHYKLHALHDSLNQQIYISNASRHDESKLEITKNIAQMYEGFDGFLADLRAHERDSKAVDSLWDTYQAGGIETANYVKEGLINGLGDWSCPNPCQWSKFDGSDDFREAKVYRLYQCCNLIVNKK